MLRLVTEPDWDGEGLLEGLEGKDRDARLAILRELHGDGVPLSELQTAARENRLMFLPVERALREEPRYSARSASRSSTPTRSATRSATWRRRSGSSSSSTPAFRLRA